MSCLSRHEADIVCPTQALHHSAHLAGEVVELIPQRSGGAIAAEVRP
jgi:hypothetical protein